RSWLTAPRSDPCERDSRTRLPPWVSDGEPLVSRLSVCAPAPVTRLPGSVPGPCFAGSRSPWPPPFAPPAPLRSGPLCSSASQLLWQSLTSRDRASSAHPQFQTEIAIFRIAGNVSGNVSSAQPSRPAGRECTQSRRVFASIVDIACGRADVDPYVAAVSPALQALCKRREASLPFRIVRGQAAQHADAAHPLRLL